MDWRSEVEVRRRKQEVAKGWRKKEGVVTDITFSTKIKGHYLGAFVILACNDGCIDQTKGENRN